uniref:PH domain-containing protein n=1 Tax=Labrus bergylta TaxID=56723 RepID=A0A3Q3EEB1_9LABR
MCVCRCCDMNGKINSERIPHSKSGNMVSELSPEGHTYTRTSRTPRKAATFGKRSNSMRRNPKAVVAKQGWLYKQASSGVKQWNKRWFILSDRCLFYYKGLYSIILGLCLIMMKVQPADNKPRRVLPERTLCSASLRGAEAVR